MSLGKGGGTGGDDLDDRGQVDSISCMQEITGRFDTDIAGNDRGNRGRCPC